MKSVNKFRPKVRSRHPSHNDLRTKLPLLPCKAVIRLGSTTELPDTESKGGKRIEINTVNAIITSSSKLKMKKAFAQGNVRSAIWIQPSSKEQVKQFFNEHSESGIVLKSHFGSRGKGNTLIRTAVELNNWLSTHTVTDYIAEKFYNYSREYRLHVTEDGCFYTCRKMLKESTPQKDRWFRNDSNSVWIMEENEQFDKPVNWNEIVKECVKAIKAVGLDFGAIDLRVQSAKDSKGKVRPECDFIVVETNSAPSFGTVTLQKYIETLPKIILKKFNKNNE